MIRRGVLRIRQEPTIVLGLALVVACGYLVVAPIVSVLSDGVVLQYRDAMRGGGDVGALTLEHLRRVFASPVASDILWQPLQRTLLVATGTTILGIGIGAGAAWLVVRTDLPWPRVWSTIFIIPFIIPTWTYVLSWFTIFRNRRIAGSLGFMEAFGFTPPDWLSYGPLPIVVVSAVSYFPLAFLLFGNAMRRMDSQLEESAHLLGAGPGTVARRIVLPLLMPALSSSVLLVFARTVGAFSGPYVLGMPTNYRVLSTSLYSAYQAGEVGVMAVLSGVMVLIGMVVVGVDVYVLRAYHRFITVSGASVMHRRVSLGRWRPVATGALIGVVVASVVVPLTALAMSTVMRIPGVFTAANLTLDFWVGDQAPGAPGMSGLLRNDALLTATANSLRLAAAAALVCAIVGMLVGYCVAKLGSSWISKALRQLTFVPYLVPSIALSAAFLSLFAVQRGPMPALYGTMTLLLLVMVVDSLPFASRAGISAMMQLGNQLEDAARVQGAGWWRRMTRIILPIQKGAFTTALVLPFISAMRELDTLVMLATPSLRTLTTYSFALVHHTQLANGVALMLVVLVFAGAWLAQRLTGANLGSGLGGSR